MGLVSAKVSALVLGPGGMAYLGLLQSLLGLSVLFAGMGIGTGLVRAGARALAEEDLQKEAALRGGAWLLCWSLGGLAVLLMILLRAPLSRLVLGDPQHSGAVVFIGAALLSRSPWNTEKQAERTPSRGRISARRHISTACLELAPAYSLVCAGAPVGYLGRTRNYFVIWAVSYLYVRRHTSTAGRSSDSS